MAVISISELQIDYLSYFFEYFQSKEIERVWKIDERKETIYSLQWQIEDKKTCLRQCLQIKFRRKGTCEKRLKSDNWKKIRKRHSSIKSLAFLDSLSLTQYNSFHLFWYCEFSFMFCQIGVISYANGTNKMFSNCVRAVNHNDKLQLCIISSMKS